MNGTVKCPQCKCLIHTADTSFALLEKNGELRQENESLRQQLADAQRIIGDQKHLLADAQKLLVERDKEIERLTKLLASYEAEPVAAYIYPAAYGSRASLCKNNKPVNWDESDDTGKWYEYELIRKPADTKHVDAIREQARREGMEEAARMLDEIADRLEQGWKEYLASGKQGPAVSFHEIPRGYAAAIRAAMKGEQHG